MSELKRNTDFTARATLARPQPGAAGIDESQPWRTADLHQAMQLWNDSAEAGFDPYNHVGSRTRKPQAA